MEKVKKQSFVDANMDTLNPMLELERPVWAMLGLVARNVKRWPSGLGQGLLLGYCVREGLSRVHEFDPEKSPQAHQWHCHV